MLGHIPEYGTSHPHTARGVSLHFLLNGTANLPCLAAGNP